MGEFFKFCGLLIIFELYDLLVCDERTGATEDSLFSNDNQIKDMVIKKRWNIFFSIQYLKVLMKAVHFS